MLKALLATLVSLAFFVPQALAVEFTPSSSNPIAPTAVDATTVTSDDFNSDGYDDLAVGAMNGLFVYLSDGDGSFTQAAGSPYFSGQYVAAVVTTDLAPGSAPDLLASVGGSFHSMMNDGSGSFTDSSQVTMLTPSTQNAAALADFNGDGDLDIASAGYNSKYQIALGNGAGVFTALTQQTVGSAGAYGLESLSAGDLDGDGDQDLALSNYPSPFNSPQYWGAYIEKGAGDGSFTDAPQSPILAPDNGFVRDLAAGQLIPGGADELAMSDLNQKLYAFDHDQSALLAPIPGGEYATGSYPIQIDLADYNNDGNLDAATADFGSYGFSVGLGDGTGALSGQGEFTLNDSDYWPSAIASGDFNGDGGLDVALTSASSDPSTIQGVGVMLASQDVKLNPASLDLGEVVVGAQSDPERVSVENDGSVDLSVSSAIVSGGSSGDFQVDNHCGASVAVGEACDVELSFSPAAAGPENTSLFVTTGAGIAVVPITATGVRAIHRVKLWVSGPEKIKAGKKLKIQTHYLNRGNVRESGLRLSVKAPRKLSRSTPSAAINQLNSGSEGSKKLKLKVRGGAALKRYKIKVKLSGGGITTVKKTLKVKVK